MSCVNEHYSPEELESIFLWDFLCEQLPLTKEERQEINDRDHFAKTGKVLNTAEELKRKRNEYNKRWKSAHKEQARKNNAAYRARHREAINERQREYDRAKRASEKAAHTTA